MKTQTIRISGVPFKITKLKYFSGGVEWRLRWHDVSGKRQTKTYRSEEDARLAANDIRLGLQSGFDLEREATGSGRPRRIIGWSFS